MAECHSGWEGRLGELIRAKVSVLDMDFNIWDDIDTRLFTHWGILFEKNIYIIC